MSNVCILITSEYPYKTQETFIEDEIRFLSAKFDQIYIFSLDVLTDEKRRFTPSNVQVFPIGKIARGNKLRFPLYVWKGLIHRPFFHEKTGNWKKFLMKTYISGKSQSEHAIISRHLKTLLHADDKICIYSYWFFNHAMIACRLKKELSKKGYRVKAFSRGHGYDIYSERNSMNYNPFQKPMIQVLDGVFSCSENGQRYLMQKYGEKLCAKKVHVSRLGTLEHGISMQKDFRKLHFVTCSHLSELKRVSLFAKAYVQFVETVAKLQEGQELPPQELHNQELHSQELNNQELHSHSGNSILHNMKPENIHWTCMGSGVEFDQIQRTIREAGLEKQVTFTGRIAHDDVMKFYSQEEITLFLNVSTTEGVPVSIMEAQSFGIPVIATDVGGTSEIVNEENGRLLSSDLTPEILCQTMLEECEEDNLRRKQKQSRSDWEKNSFADLLYDEWCSFLVKEIQ